jgi:hypothetical protein
VAAHLGDDPMAKDGPFPRVVPDMQLPRDQSNLAINCVHAPATTFGVERHYALTSAYCQGLCDWPGTGENQRWQIPKWQCRFPE